VPGEGPQGRLGLGRTQIDAPWRVTLAWLALLTAGISMALTGELTWRIGAIEVYGEYVVSFIAYGLAGAVLWWLGLRSDGEHLAARCTLLAVLPALVAIPGGQMLRWPAEFMLHLFLVLQLAAWLREAARLRAREAWPVGIMVAGMAVETCGLLAKMVLTWGVGMDLPPECAGAMWLTCAGSPYQAFALPAVMTVAMAPYWLGAPLPWTERS
jgi:hypothetical protein